VSLNIHVSRVSSSHRSAMNNN